MASYKEIVTKAVIGKGKKTFTTTNSVTPEITPSTILGCWVINHTFNGRKEDGKVVIEGSYDINIWYSCENDTKTEVIKQTNNYKEIVSIRKNSEVSNGSNEEIIVRSLKQPNCTKAIVDGNNISYTIEKELGIEIVGDTKVKIETNEEDDDWEEISDEETINEVEEKIDTEVKEEFID